ncbi:MAG: outer membrane protein transport protein [Oligoflexia bacterium]|nr:outer membrane protein transport protein [Oligoflexia bacterium]
MKNVFVLLLIFACPLSSYAGLWSQWGYGARSQGLANSTVAFHTDAYSQAYNAALMADDPKFLFSGGIQGAIFKFEPIKSVLVDTTDLGGASNQISDVSTYTPDVFSLALGIQVPLGKSERPWVLGATLSSPVLKLFYLDTQDAFYPQYVLYLSESQRLTTGFSLAKKLTDELSLGATLNVYLIQAATARTRLPAGGNSTARLRMEVKPALAPAAGLVIRVGEQSRVGFSYQGRQNSQGVIDFNNTISLLAPSDLVLTSRSTLYYEPDTFILGFSHTQDDQTLTASGSWEKWSDYQGTPMALSFTTFTGSFSQRLPPIKYSDIVSAKIGFEKRYEDSGWAWRVGLGYLPSPAPDSSGESNVLDSDRYHLALGMSKKLSLGDLEKPLRVDLVGFYQHLKEKTIRKTSNAFIGAPGYKIGGFIAGYSVTGTLEF